MPTASPTSSPPASFSLLYCCQEATFHPIVTLFLIAFLMNRAHFPKFIKDFLSFVQSFAKYTIGKCVRIQIAAESAFKT
jgi:hypothetical protein